MIRRAAEISEGHEENVFKPIGWEEFSSKTARLEALPQLCSESLPLLELIRDSFELKKLNNNFVKVTIFEDLIADLYARVYELNLPSLNEQVNEEKKEKMKVDHLLMTGDGTADTPDPTASTSAADAPAPRGRTKGIARRDIQKRADTIVNLKLGPRAASNKLTAVGDADQPAPTHPGSGASSGPTSAPRDLAKQPTEAGDDDDDDDAQMLGGNNLNDTADESELSDVDESKLDLTLEHKSMFSKIHRDEGRDGETETEGEGADEGDPQGDGEEQGDEEEVEEDGEEGAEGEIEEEEEEEEGDENEADEQDEIADTETEEGGDEDIVDERDEDVQDDEADPSGDVTKLEEDDTDLATEKDASKTEDNPSEIVEGQGDDQDMDDVIHDDEVAETPDAMDVTE